MIRFPVWIRVSPFRFKHFSLISEKNQNWSVSLCFTVSEDAGIESGTSELAVRHSKQLG